MRHLTRYSTRPVPVPGLRYQASDLDPSLTAVTSWPNVGRLGAGYDLAVAANNVAPAYFPSGGYNDGAYVRFAGGDMLESLTALPAEFTLKRGRVLLARILLEPGPNSGTQRNFFGTGAVANGQLTDLTLFPDETIIAHEYYAGSDPTPQVPRGQWLWVGLSVGLPQPGYVGDAYASSTFSQFAFAGTLESIRRNNIYGMDTQPAPLRLGGGAYEGWNTLGTPFWLDTLALYPLLTDPERQLVMG